MSELLKNQKISVRESRVLLSKQLDIGQRTISNVITEYNYSKTVSSPFKTRQKKSFVHKFDDLQLNAVRRYIHSFLFNKTIPTKDKILQVINEDDSLPNNSRTNLQRLLTFMDFVYTKRSRNSTLIEKDEIVRRYLRDVQKYREEGRHLNYLDETWVNAGDCTSKTWVDVTTIKSPCDAFLRGLTTGSQNPSGKGKRQIL